MWRLALGVARVENLLAVEGYLEAVASMRIS